VKLFSVLVVLCTLYITKELSTYLANDVKTVIFHNVSLEGKFKLISTMFSTFGHIFVVYKELASLR
jgi:hypothetical protein